MTASRTDANSLQAFLRQDLARLPAAVLRRCGALDGRRLYLSGATGFFGSNLLALLAELHGAGARFEVTALSRDPQRFLLQQCWCRDLPWLRWRQGDARGVWPDDGAHDLILHAATDTAASAHIDPTAVFEDILAGVRQALACAQRSSARRLLLCGSGAQYGAIPEQWAAGIPESSSLACDPMRPASAYGEAKRAGELLAMLQAQRQPLAVVSARGFAFVGPGLPLDGHFAIGNFIADALALRPITLNTDGAPLRSYLYGADLAVWLLVLLLEGTPGQAVNVGSDQALSIAALARSVSSLIHPGSDVQLGPPSPTQERQYYIPDIARARSLGLDVWTPLDQAIVRTAQWQRQAHPPSLSAAARIR